jgi:hypothetical protein
MTRQGGPVLDQKTDINARKNGEGYRLPDSECPIPKYANERYKCLECPLPKCELLSREKTGEVFRV